VWGIYYCAVANISLSLYKKKLIFLTVESYLSRLCHISGIKAVRAALEAMRVLHGLFIDE